jgi:hypothetical protein
MKVNLYNWHRSNGQNKIQAILARSVAVEEAVPSLPDHEIIKFFFSETVN